MKKLNSLVVALVAFAMPLSAFASDGSVTDKAYIAFAAGMAIAIAALGGTLAQGRAAAATVEGIARNPAAADKLFVPMLLGLALIESLTLLGFVIAFLLVGKLGA